MILRKPYAFLIKYFRLIHGIIFFMGFYVIRKLISILSFITSVSNVSTVLGEELVDKYFTDLLFALPYIIIVLLIIILCVMVRKKKPYFFYIYNILTYILVIAMLYISKSVISTLEVEMIDIRTIRMVRDILMIASLVGSLGLMFVFVRFIGFDIKKFNFGKDMKELDVSDADREEFELSFSFEGNIVTRNINKKKRQFKYFYVENRFIVNICICVFIVSTIVTSYILSIKPPHNVQNEILSADIFEFRIDNCLTTTNDYRNKIVTEEQKGLVVLDMALLSYGEDIYYEIANSYLEINDHRFYANNKYRDALFDIGTMYNGEMLSQEWKNYIIAFEVPKTYLTSSMTFHYIKEKGSIIVDLNPVSLDENPTTTQYALKEVANLETSILSKGTINIDGIDLSNKFTINYKFCVTTKECYDSKEYVKASYTGNNDKVLLKIVGKVSDLETNAKGINTLYDLIYNFGTLKYKIGETVITNKTNFNRITSKKYKELNTYYVEVDNEILNATSISLLINVRNTIYEFILK